MAEVDLFQANRPRLFGVAYRMLGSASDAEDVVQDAWLRYAMADPADLRSPLAYLTTIVTRLCLDRLKSARSTREDYIGPWLPEPVLTGNRQEPEASLALAESVTLAFMVLLETLSPEERAVFLLREVFDHEYADIAAIVGTTPANCRQLFHRAKARIADKRPRFRDGADAEGKRRLARRFVSALQDSDGDALRSMLTEDVGFWSDGGGKVLAARRPVFGRASVANLLLGIRRTAPATGIPLDAVTVDIVEVNREPAIAFWVSGRLDAIYALTMNDAAIGAIRIVRNPDKLRFVERQLSGA